MLHLDLIQFGNMAGRGIRDSGKKEQQVERHEAKLEQVVWGKASKHPCKTRVLTSRLMVKPARGGLKVQLGV